MDKQQEESRRQFEEWWEKFYETSPREPWGVIYSPEHDYYCDQDVDGQYDAWKASRASIVVELPSKSFYFGDNDLLKGAVSMVADRQESRFIESLRSIGLSIKGE
ncbi:TPA: hypothetical protein KEY88_005303 [Serratia marcescens]|nr:hypothetical protein [Serratia marcescens]